MARGENFARIWKIGVKSGFICWLEQNLFTDDGGFFSVFSGVLLTHRTICKKNKKRQLLEWATFKFLVLGLGRLGSTSSETMFGSSLKTKNSVMSFLSQHRLVSFRILKPMTRPAWTPLAQSGFLRAQAGGRLFLLVGNPTLSSPTTGNCISNCRQSSFLRGDGSSSRGPGLQQTAQVLWETERVAQQIHSSQLLESESLVSLGPHNCTCNSLPHQKRKAENINSQMDIASRRMKRSFT